MCIGSFIEKTTQIDFTLNVNAGFSMAHKSVQFDPFLPPMTPKTVNRGNNDVPQNSQIFLFPEVNVPQFLNNVVKMSLRSCQ